MVRCLQTPQSLYPTVFPAALTPGNSHAGQDSSSIDNWTEELSSHFSAAHKSLNAIKAIVIPSPSDILIITTDGASSNGGIGSILYVLRDGVMHVGGFFSARLKQHQVNWLPCEIEALAIS